MRRKEGDKGGDILRAAVRIFARDGFDAAKVSAIAELAEVATGSVYLYYSGKDDILDSIFREFWEGLREAIERIDRRDPLDRIHDQLGLFYDQLARDRDLGMVYLREHHRFLGWHPGGHESFNACMEYGQKAFREASGHAPDSGTFALSLAILMGGVRSALEHAFSQTEQLNEPVRNHMLVMAMASIRALAKGGAL